ncbi:hypothetical protein V8E36_009130, partial [Tilletia maclaganii]
MVRGRPLEGLEGMAKERRRALRRQGTRRAGLLVRHALSPHCSCSGSAVRQAGAGSSDLATWSPRHAGSQSDAARVEPAACLSTSRSVLSPGSWLAACLPVSLYVQCESTLAIWPLERQVDRRVNSTTVSVTAQPLSCLTSQRNQVRDPAACLSFLVTHYSFFSASTRLSATHARVQPARIAATEAAQHSHAHSANAPRSCCCTVLRHCPSLPARARCEAPSRCLLGTQLGTTPVVDPVKITYLKVSIHPLPS